MIRPVTPVYHCEVCGKPTARLFGLGAMLRLLDGGVVCRTVVWGYCLTHREEVPSRFDAYCRAGGEPEWIGNPMRLKPQEVQGFFAWANRMYVNAAHESGLPDPLGSKSIEQCPHCCGTLSLGTGPHVEDAQQRDGAIAWECPACETAGIVCT